MRARNHKIEDRILLKKAARESCRQSLAIIYLKYRPIICDYLLKIGAGDACEDICQSVFMQLHDNKCDYNGSTDAKSYLFGVAFNQFKQHLKLLKEKTYGLSPIKVKGDLLVKHIIHNCPAEILEKAESHQKIVEIILELPSKSRGAIWYSFFESHKNSCQVGHKISSKGSELLRKRVAYAVKLIRKKMNP